MNKKIVITGGSGFLGRRLGRRLREAGFEVVLASRNNKQNFQASTFSGCRSLALDVTNIESVRDIFAQERPDIVVHAAATKFVDISETQPMETIDVNVVGSQNVARVAIDKGVGLVVGISTDKAAPPVRNTYGLSKAIMERMFCSMDGRGGTAFLCVRYGNVAWSTASVLTQWRQQLDAEGVIKTTGPEMLRFFFTVDEAVELVMTGIAHADMLHGSLLSRYMKAAQIKDILEVWCRQAGVSYVKIAGRPGERNEETLIGEQELPYTRIWEHNGIRHYIVSFNRRTDQPLEKVFSAGTTDRMTPEEISCIINNPPADEH
jgi:UDP-N-acetylglucosamine 4,6-dehydratase/5-epimerase